MIERRGLFFLISGGLCPTDSALKHSSVSFSYDFADLNEALSSFRVSSAEEAWLPLWQLREIDPRLIPEIRWNQRIKLVVEERDLPLLQSQLDLIETLGRSLVFLGSTRASFLHWKEYCQNENLEMHFQHVELIHAISTTDFTVSPLSHEVFLTAPMQSGSASESHFRREVQAWIAAHGNGLSKVWCPQDQWISSVPSRPAQEAKDRMGGFLFGLPSAQSQLSNAISDLATSIVWLDPKLFFQLVARFYWQYLHSALSSFLLVGLYGLVWRRLLVGILFHRIFRGVFCSLFSVGLYGIVWRRFIVGFLFHRYFREGIINFLFPIILWPIRKIYWFAEYQFQTRIRPVLPWNSGGKT